MGLDQGTKGQWRGSFDVKPKPKEAPASVITDRKALEWQKRNEWFGSTSTKDRIMTQAAMVIHKELIDEGILPNSNPDEYYNELDSRVREEFPERFKTKRTKCYPNQWRFDQ